MSAGELVRGAMALYREHFGVLVLTYMIALIPAHLFVRPFVSGITGMTGYFVLILLTGFIAYAALAVAVSDICIGNKPSVVRCYKYVFTKNVFRLFLTILLTMLVLLSCYILFIILGIVFSAWYMFSAVVVVLAKVGPSAAMNRSRFLGRGFYARTYCLFALTSFVLGVIGFLVGLTSGTAIIVL